MAEMQKMAGMKQMVHVYAADIRNLPDPLEAPRVMDGLSEERKKKIVRYKQPEGRRQSLGAGLLLRQALARHGMQETEVYIGKNGKPEVKGICFNLSHSHNIVVCAIGEKPVGCDVEKEESSAKEKVAERFFCDTEIAYLKDKKEEFFRFWTMKESYVKMTGEGLRLPLNQFEIRFEERVKIYRDGKTCACFLKEYEIPGYRLTVCSEESEFVPRLEYILLANNGGS